MHPRNRRRAVVAALSLSLAAGLAACGEDEEGADIDAACEAHARVVAGFTTLFTTLPEPPEDGPPPPELASQLRSAFDANVAVPLAELVGNAPDEIQDEVEEISSVLRQFRDDADPSVIEGDRFDDLTTAVDAYLQEDCPGTKATVQALNYRYEGLAPTLPAGTVRIELVNVTDEAHEMVVVVRQAGVTETYDQILALPEDQIESKIDFVQAASTDPGETRYLIATMPVGDYLFVCTYGQGTTDDDEPADGPPHFTLGMKQEVKVT